MECLWSWLEAIIQPRCDVEQYGEQKLRKSRTSPNSTRSIRWTWRRRENLKEISLSQISNNCFPPPIVVEQTLLRQYNSMERLTSLVDRYFGSELGEERDSRQQQQQRLISANARSITSLTSTRSGESFPLRDNGLNRRCLPLHREQWGEDLSKLDPYDHFEFAKVFEEGIPEQIIEEIPGIRKKKSLGKSIRAYCESASGLYERRRLAKEWRNILGDNADPRPWSAKITRNPVPRS